MPPARRPLREIQQQQSIQPNFLEKLYTNNKSALSGIILFGFDLECLKERQINDSQVQIQKNKYFHQLKFELQKKSRLQTLAYDICSRIESTLDLHNFHNTKLDHVELNIDESPIKFQNVDLKKSNLQILDSIVRACD
ncbi:21483_t:CDS:2 [Dentiscutata erythropus]|uniref:21483_t:CDS:1 n=1 Tax=Dentiscutata erythropus TaxID=1348616 RepID=A0A9N9CMG2_9GLOM|nr:21483_t:CDS:2 [Dentiscutata erythropus]